MNRGAGIALALVVAAGLASVNATAAPFTLPDGARAERLSPQQLGGWAQDDHAAAFAIFARGCMADPPLRQAVALPDILAIACDKAKLLAAKGDLGRDEARSFFERNFSFWRIRPAGVDAGFTTGYFEPEFEGSLTRSEAFPTPLYGRPPDLVTRFPEDDWPGLDKALSAARRTARGLEPLPSVPPSRPVRSMGRGSRSSGCATPSIVSCCRCRAPAACACPMARSRG